MNIVEFFNEFAAPRSNVHRSNQQSFRDILEIKFESAFDERFSQSDLVDALNIEETFLFNTQTNRPLMNQNFTNISELDTFDYETVCPYVLVSVEIPNIICAVNQKFTEKFLCSHDLIRGLPLRIFQDLDCAAWTSMLASAKSGQVCRGLVRISIPWSLIHPFSYTEDVVCLPIFEPSRGRVEHIMVVFSPEAPSSTAPPSAIAAHALPSSNLKDGSGCDALPAYRPEPRVVRPAARRLLVQPRRKAAQPGEPRAPVAVTPQLIDAVRALPIRQAAAAVGLSASAFKRACRRLGVSRWAYQRRRPASRSSLTSDGSMTAATAAHSSVAVIAADVESDRRMDAALPVIPPPPPPPPPPTTTTTTPHACMPATWSAWDAPSESISESAVDGWLGCRPPLSPAAARLAPLWAWDAEDEGPGGPDCGTWPAVAAAAAGP